MSAVQFPAEMALKSGNPSVRAVKSVANSMPALTASLMSFRLHDGAT